MNSNNSLNCVFNHWNRAYYGRSAKFDRMNQSGWTDFSNPFLMLRKYFPLCEDCGKIMRTNRANFSHVFLTFILIFKVCFDIFIQKSAARKTLIDVQSEIHRAYLEKSKIYNIHWEKISVYLFLHKPFCGQQIGSYTWEKDLLTRKHEEQMKWIRNIMLKKLMIQKADVILCTKLPFNH